MKPKEQSNELEETKKTYSQPQIIHEIELETKAGSPSGGDLLPPGLP
jgi:hypothetical protein